MRTKTTLRKGVQLGTLALSALALVGLAAPWSDERSLCRQAEDWVAAHRGDLPQTLEDLSSLPSLYRAKVFDNYPAQTKSRLFREHLQAVSNDSTDLNPEQRALITEAIALFSPRLYALSADDPERGAALERVQDLEVRARVLFGTAQADVIFSNLGPPRPTYRLPSSWPILARNGIRQIFETVSAQDPIEKEDFRTPCDCGPTRACPNLEWCIGGDCRAVWCGPGWFDLCVKSCVATAPAEPRNPSL